MPERDLDRTLVLAGKRPKTLRIRVVDKTLEQTTNGKTTVKAFDAAYLAEEAFDKTIRTKLRADYCYVEHTREVGAIMLQAFGSGGGSDPVLDISPDGTHIVTAARSDKGNNAFSSQLEVVEVATGARRIVMEEPANDSCAFLYNALFDRSGGGIYFALRERTEHVDLASGIRRVVARGGGIRDGFNGGRPSFDAARRRLVVFDADLTVRVLDEREATLLELPMRSPTLVCRRAALSPSGNLLAVYVASRGVVFNHADAKEDTTNHIQLWDLESRKLWETVEVTMPITDIGITPSDDQLVITSSGGPVWLAIPSGDKRARMSEPDRPDELPTCDHWAYSPDGTRLALAGHRLRVLDVATGKDIPLARPFGVLRADRVAFSADGKRLAAFLGRSAYVYAL